MGKGSKGNALTAEVVVAAGEVSEQRIDCEQREREHGQCQSRACLALVVLGRMAGHAQLQVSWTQYRMLVS
jgi:hypothetical protein